MPVSSDVLNQTLALPLAERADLAYHLLRSLEPPEADESPDALEAELLARLDAVESGACQTRDWHEAITDMRRALKEGREP